MIYWGRGHCLKRVSRALPSYHAWCITHHVWVWNWYIDTEMCLMSLSLEMLDWFRIGPQTLYPPVTCGGQSHRGTDISLTCWLNWSKKSANTNLSISCNYWKGSTVQASRCYWHSRSLISADRVCELTTWGKSLEVLCRKSLEVGCLVSWWKKHPWICQVCRHFHDNQSVKFVAERYKPLGGMRIEVPSLLFWYRYWISVCPSFFLVFKKCVVMSVLSEDGSTFRVDVVLVILHSWRDAAMRAHHSGLIHKLVVPFTIQLCLVSHDLLFIYVQVFLQIGEQEELEVSSGKHTVVPTCECKYNFTFCMCLTLDPHSVPYLAMIRYNFFRSIQQNRQNELFVLIWAHGYLYSGYNTCCLIFLL